MQFGAVLSCGRELTLEMNNAIDLIDGALHSAFADHLRGDLLSLKEKERVERRKRGWEEINSNIQAFITRSRYFLFAFLLSGFSVVFGRHAVCDKFLLSASAVYEELLLFFENITQENEEFTLTTSH